MKEKLIADAGATLFQPESLLSAQFFPALRQKAQGQGERRLIVAILEDAVECFQKHFWATDNRGRQLRVEAERWLFSEDNSWLFSFANICDTLDIHPMFLRRGLARWKAYQMASGEFWTRQNAPQVQDQGQKRNTSQPRPLRAVGEA